MDETRSIKCFKREINSIHYFIINESDNYAERAIPMLQPASYELDWNKFFLQQWTLDFGGN